MIFIDLEHKRPTDNDIPGWMPWTQAQWDAWLATSKQLIERLAALEAAGGREERNVLIDKNKPHWDALKPWLLALSGGKCWFSEVRELYSHYDVEHFRPKKAAKALNGVKRDGYWWLAFDYMNLRLCGNVGNRKKGGWFPLKQGSLCSTYAEPCEESESRYLLDPIDDDDVSLIAFDEEGKVIPVPGASDWERERVSVTVQRLKLNEHVPLAEERRKVWQKVDALIDEFFAAKAKCSTGNNPAAKAKLLEVRSRVREMTQRSAELSAVARWCIQVRNEPQLSRLVA
ncbi:hypothetical protein SMRA8_2103 [Stenotrophomonas maltophilia RA8]|uniref:hypothetical protein n=1 Tax=Stenotrophomonas maltophilia TaxID=40324 RepID=UPI0002C539AA|nr:hypothetical protein [Stenotrophomonas maltophilia]QGL75964.1 hypothetical protein FEO95_10175 [Stenotrophomonas maltophilia]CCP16233.1 hypothetical protein SMRA8_2103 [Stenotrophomonas maltophilia RA8]